MFGFEQRRTHWIEVGKNSGFAATIFVLLNRGRVLQNGLGARGRGVVYAEVEDEFKGAVWLFAPERCEVSCARRLFVRRVVAELVWAGRPAEVARARNVRVGGPPREQSRRRWVGLRPDFDGVDGPAPEDDAVGRCEVEERVLHAVLD